MPETILITGASGLLGRALVAAFSRAGFHVLGQFHRHPGRDSRQVDWIAGDLSSEEGIREFLRRHRKKLSRCGYLINNFGPLRQKQTALVSGRELCADFALQLAPALAISRFLLQHAPLRAVLNIGFEYTGRHRAYRRILGYAMGKNALLLLTVSLAAAFPAVRFNLFSPPSLLGAEILPEGAVPVAPRQVAEHIVRIIGQRRSGAHYRYLPVRAKSRAR
jgi:NAD(P)-dependent dehydrogenase (short-subunit alcohol dehydrogenase family)